MSLGFYLKWTIQNLRNHLARSILTGIGIGVAVAILICILGIYRGYKASLSESIEQMGFHVLVTAKGCPYEAATLILRGGQIPMYIDEQIYREIVGNPRVDFAAKLFLQTQPADEGQRFNFFMGIEQTFLQMKPWMSFQRGGWFSSGEADEVLLGFNVATYLNKDVNDTIELGKPVRAYRVAGIFDRVGSQDDGTIFLPLEVAQKLFDRKDKLTGLGVRVKNLEELDLFIEEIYDLPTVQVIATAQIQGTLLRLVESMRSVMLSIGVSAAIIAILALINTVLMSVFERTPEFGVFRAVGGGGLQLFYAVCLETAVMSFFGAIIGNVLVMLLQQSAEAFVRTLLPFSPAGSILRINPADQTFVILLTLAAGVFCGLYPAYRATRVSPIQSLRYGE